MKFLQPIERVGKKKFADFIASEVEDKRAPLAMLAFARVFVLVERGAVETKQSVRVAGEMRGDPIENHSDAGLVAGVDEIAKIVGRAEARSGREISCDLIAPGAGKRMLHHGHQFQMRVAH